MAKVGRNDPCPCGSGKKYKQCHSPIEAAEASAERALRQAPDTLLPKLLDAVARFADALPPALDLFWNGKYHVHTVQELDEDEDRGSERFLTWFLFDHLIDGQTPFVRLAADTVDLDLSEAETALMAQWADIRLQPYIIEDLIKGQGFTVRPLWGDTSIPVEDHAATKRVEAGDLLIMHILPVTTDTNFITGAAAHLSADTLDPLREFAALHLADLQRSQPDATYADLICNRSHVFNHFVMALPRDGKELSKLDELVVHTRAMLNVATDSMGFGKAEAPQLAVPAVTEPVASEVLERSEPQTKPS